MARFVVLLRGVNVGKGNRVPMADFKALLQDLGAAEVTTVLNSGNAVFTSRARSVPRLADAIAAELERRLAVSTPAIVKSAAEMRAIVDGVPQVPADAGRSRFLVVFARDAAALAALRPLASIAQAPDRLDVTEHAAYLHCPAGALDSRVGAALLGKAARQVTTRTWDTVLKLAALTQRDSG